MSEYRTVYVVSMYSSGERWHTYVCGSKAAVVRTMAQKDMVSRASMIGSELPEIEFGDYWEFENSKDSSQTATVMAQYLVEM